MYLIRQLTREQISMGGMLEYMPMPSRARPDWECSVNGPLRANGPLCGNEQSTLSRTR